MTDVEATYEDFIASRRSGRRNAIHEIPGSPGVQEAADLSQLIINKSGDEEDDTEKGQESSAKEEETPAEGP